MDTFRAVTNTDLRRLRCNYFFHNYLPLDIWYLDTPKANQNVIWDLKNLSMLYFTFLQAFIKNKEIARKQRIDLIDVNIYFRLLHTNAL